MVRCEQMHVLTLFCVSQAFMVNELKDAKFCDRSFRILKDNTTVTAEEWFVLN